MTNTNTTNTTPTTTFAIGSDLVLAFQHYAYDVLAESADEVGICGAVHVDAEGLVTIRVEDTNTYVRLVQDWYSARVEDEWMPDLDRRPVASRLG
jgi:hypothetical protein